MSPAPTTDEFRQFREEVLDAIRDLRQSLETGYQRKDVADRESQLLGIQITGLEGEVHTLGKRIDGLTEQRDRERDTLIDRMRGNNRFVVAALVTGLAGPFLTLLLAHSLGIK